MQTDSVDVLIKAAWSLEENRKTIRKQISYPDPEEEEQRSLPDLDVSSCCDSGLAASPMVVQYVPEMRPTTQVLPRMWRLAPRLASLRGPTVCRRSFVVQAHSSTAATADNVANTASQLPSGPSFQYFLSTATQPTLGSSSAPLQSQHSDSARKVYIETYGCQMNVNDSEVLLSVLADNGYAQTQQDTDADIIFLNTCAIREQAEQRIWSRLAVLKSLKNKNKDR